MYLFEQDQLTNGQTASIASSENIFYIQTSLLYTNEKRQRMLRVHNYGVPISSTMSQVFGHIDFQTVIAALVRRNLAQYVSSKPLPDIQIDVINQFKKLFSGIAAHTSQTEQQNMLPYIALGFLGTLKNSIFQSQFINNC